MGELGRTVCLSVVLFMLPKCERSCAVGSSPVGRKLKVF
jgi:hypothetical protein